MDVTALYRSVGQRIILRRAELGMTQAELGARITLSRASIANIERGHQKLSLHQVYQLAEALDLVVADLLPVGSDRGSALVGIEISGAEELSDAARRQIEQLYHDVGANS